MVVTACFDVKVRIFVLEFDLNGDFLRWERAEEILISTTEFEYDSFNTLLDHRHPNCLQFNGDTLYIGDSKGTIHIWDVKIKGNIAEARKNRII